MSRQWRLPQFFRTPPSAAFRKNVREKMSISLERVKTEDFLELHGLLYVPKQKTDTVVLHCHGMAGNFYENRFVNITGLKLVSEGIAFCAMNNRGHDFIADFIVEKDGKIEYKRIGEVYERIEDSVKDIAAWVDFLKAKGFTKIILMGHSLGAVKAVLYASEHQQRLSGLILASPPDMLCLARNEKDFSKKIKEAKELVASKQENVLLKETVFESYPISAGTYLNLFGDDSAADVFSISSEKEPKKLKSVSVPLLILFGENDDCFNYNSEGITKFFKTHAPDAKFIILSNANHTYLNEEKTFAKTVAEFVKEVK